MLADAHISSLGYLCYYGVFKSTKAAQLIQNPQMK